MTRHAPLAFNAQLRWDVVRTALPTNATTVLEVGCGLGGVASRLADKYPDLVAVEPDSEAWRVAAARVGSRGRVLNCVVDDLPGGWTFDLVCAFEVLEHLEDDAGALKSFVSRLRPGGRLLVSTPAWGDRLAAADERAGHYRRYDPEGMARLLKQAGLDDVAVRCYGGPAGYALEYGRNLVAAWSLRRPSTPDGMVERTAGSGRYFQPVGGAASWAVGAAGLPLRAVSRLSGGHGPGLVARATRPFD